MISSIKHKLRTFSQFSARQLTWLLPLYVLSGLARLLILTVPFRRIWPFLGQHIEKTTMTPLLNPRQELIAIEMATVIRTLSKYALWTSNCFVEAVLARIVLRWYKIPYVIYFGVKTDKNSDSPLAAHAWVSAGRCFVAGGNGLRNFTVVSSFTNDSDIVKSIHHVD